jgi:hypothetical protein
VDLDGFIKLNDAQRADATAGADITGKLASADSTLADIPQKLAQADLTEQQAINQLLKNFKLSQEIQWDADAHRQLLRERNKKLQEAERIAKERPKLNSALLHVGALIRGAASIESIGYGWMAFAYLRDHAPVTATIKAAETPPADSAFDKSSWGHPLHDVPDLPQDRNGGALLDWAAKHSCYPKWGSMAFAFVAGFLQSLSDAAAVEAAEIQTRLDAAQKAASELETRDWDRLKNVTEVK